MLLEFPFAILCIVVCAFKRLLPPSPSPLHPPHTHTNILTHKWSERYKFYICSQESIVISIVIGIKWILLHDYLIYRRGHDNTGVTDRVVNQLLTQLDGVEGLEGKRYTLWNPAIKTSFMIGE